MELAKFPRKCPTEKMPLMKWKDVSNGLMSAEQTAAVENTSQPALMNDVILQQIFDLLPVEDFKICRLVCQKWKMVAEPSFKKRVRLHFDCTHPSDRPMQYYLCPEDLNAFFTATQTEFPFSALTLDGDLHWSTRTLSNYFSTEGRFITDLVLCNVILNIKNVKQTSYSLSKFIQGIESLKRLRIINNSTPSECATVFQVSLDDLKNMEYVGLEKCQLDLTEDKICPEELHLRKVRYIRNNVPFKKVLINDFVDFSAMKVLSVVNSYDTSPGSVSISLDLSGSIKLCRLKLAYVIVLNFGFSSWNVKCLDITLVTIPPRYSLQFEELTISYSRLSLKNLPTTVNRLIVGSRTTFTDESPFEASLPNIKFLELNFTDPIEEIFPHLRTAFNHVTELKLKSYNRCTINVNLIPESVQILTLHEDEYEFVGDKILTLEKLVIEKIESVEFLLKISTHLAPRNLEILRNFCGLKYQYELDYLKTFLKTSISFVSLGHFYGRLLHYLKRRPSYETIDDFNGQIVNEKGSVIQFAFIDKITTLANLRQTKIPIW